MKLAVAAACMLVLAGCQSKQIEEMNYSERKDLAGQIAQRCYDQGVKPGSSEYETCSRVEVQREAALRKRSSERQTRNVRVSAYCQNFGGNTVCF